MSFTKSPTLGVPLGRTRRAVWSAGQVVALVVTALLLVALVVIPETALTLAWYAIVPLLPASFLVNAGLWRGICPIATANTVWKRDASRVPSARWVARAGVVGMVLLFFLVPARRLVLNSDGLFLAGTLVAIVAVAAILGWRYRTKAGFCNSLCPILPVEKLYGQSPLLWVQNPRCLPCDHCSIRGCMDLNQRSAAHGGKNTSALAWLRTPIGVFSVLFPGLVWGYFQSGDAPLTAWLEVYTTTLAPAVVGGVILAALVSASRLPSRVWSPVTAALAVGIYYWYAGPSSAEALKLPEWLGEGFRWAFLGLVGIWLVVAISRQRH